MAQPKGPQDKDRSTPQEKRQRESTAEGDAGMDPTEEGARKSGHVETGREAREHGERLENEKPSDSTPKDKPASR